jgi:hypothetical protein
MPDFTSAVSQFVSVVNLKKEVSARLSEQIHTPFNKGSQLEKGNF